MGIFSRIRAALAPRPGIVFEITGADLSRVRPHDGRPRQERRTQVLGWDYDGEPITDDWMGDSPDWD